MEQKPSYWRQIGINISQQFRRYERHFFVFLLLAGSITDALFLPRIDSKITYLLLGSTLFVVIIGTILSAVITDRPLVGKRWKRVEVFLDLIIPFLVGSLLSAIFVYYTRSASIFVSAPFLALLFLVMISTEFARDRMRQLELRIVIIYFILYFGVSFALPVFVGHMGPFWFILSGACAFATILTILFLLMLHAPGTLRKGGKTFLVVIASVTIFINTLYFFHFIPPIPLALRVAEVYHGVSRMDDGSYAVLIDTMQQTPTWSFVDPTVRIINGEPLSLFTAVFAPVEFETSIVHVWELRDVNTRRWKTKTKITFPISGGKDTGYRGYSTVRVTPGNWRVSVETTRGEVLGVEYFNAVTATAPIQFEQRIR